MSDCNKRVTIWYIGRNGEPPEVFDGFDVFTIDEKDILMEWHTVDDKELIKIEFINRNTIRRMSVDCLTKTKW